ncbi:hypothetical protein F5Y17DRAFT_154586 [Xylariaceae sp. FL0594]|nr:hypothetical protein F5Y17DRAFT_154586 [Xylariaceae sp. FL0594]
MLDTLPVELLRLVYSFCDGKTVPNLRAVSRTLALVGDEYLVSPHFTSVSWRNDIDRLHCIALHERLRGHIKSINIYLGEFFIWDACARHRELPEEERRLQADVKMADVDDEKLDPLHMRADDLREAFSELPNLRDLAVTFDNCPVPCGKDMKQDMTAWVKQRGVEPPETRQNLDAIMFALHGIKLSSFKVERVPLDMFRMANHRLHWFTHAQSFSSLSSLDLTLDPLELKGPSSAFRAINGLGRVLHLATNLIRLRLAFRHIPNCHRRLHSRGQARFALSLRELFFDFTYTRLRDLALEGVSCDEEDLKEFLGRHGATLARLRLGGRGLVQKPSDTPCGGGVHLYDGTFRSLFTDLRAKLPKLERVHLEGMFECEHPSLQGHEAYNFYPLTDENWEPVPIPEWVRASESPLTAISCQPFEHYILRGGVYPGRNFNSMAQAA